MPLGTHTGAWGLPELGFTESVAKWFNKPTNNQGGSEVFGSPSKAQVQGAATTTPSGGQMYSAPIGPTSKPATTTYKAPTNKAPTNTVSAPSSSIDLSNRAKMDDYARSMGYPGWNEYQSALSRQAYENSPEAQQARERESALRNQIGSGFDNLKQGYSDLVPYYSQEGDRRVGQVADTYKTIFSGLDEAKQAGMSKLNLSREEVGRRAANSVQDLKQNLNQVMRNTGMQLGAMGAGDTSASQVMAPYAYTKMAGKEFGGIARQANEQFGTIDQKGVDLEQEYGAMYNQTEIEKSSQIEAIRSDVGSQIARIREMIPQVDAQKAQALAGLEQSLLTQAQQALTQIQAEDRQRKDSLQQWALQRVAQLNDAKISIQDSANFNPTEIMYNEIRGVGSTPAYGQDQEAYFNPQMLAQKRRQELGL